MDVAGPKVSAGFTHTSGRPFAASRIASASRLVHRVHVRDAEVARREELGLVGGRAAGGRPSAAALEV